MRAKAYTTIDERTCGFAVSTTGQEMIEENARERCSEDTEDREQWAAAGLVTPPNGEITAAGWEQINKDVETLENNGVKFLERKALHARDEGHGSDGSLVGTLFLNWRNSRHRALVLDPGDTIDDDTVVYRCPEHMSGREYQRMMRGVSDFGAALLDVTIELFNLDELKKGTK